MAVKRSGSGSPTDSGEDEVDSQQIGTAKLEVTSPTSTSASVDRRDFLKLFGSSVSAAAAAGCDIFEPDSIATGALHIDGNLPIDFTFNAVRREDFVNLRFDFINLVPDKHHRVFERKTSGSPTIVIVNFPSQHVFEAAFGEFEAPAPDALPDDTEEPIGTRLSGPSRVAFTVPDSVGDIEFSLDGLLELLGQLEMHVARNATPPGSREVPAAAPLAALNSSSGNGHSSITAQLLRSQRGAFAKKHWLPPTQAQPLAAEQEEVTGPPAEPFNHETAIEIPYRLLLSPNRHGAWAHSVQPVTGISGRYELWHSRLGVRGPDGLIDERDPSLRKVRALWSRDESFRADEPDKELPDAGSDDVIFPEDGGPLIERETMAFKHRSQIVHLTSNFEIFTETGDDPLPRPVDVNNLMLSSMGGWLDSKGLWRDTTLQVPAALEEWEHRATLGRDHFVKLVEKGVLYPFGHIAKRITISERKFRTDEGDDHAQVAYLRQRVLIFVSEPVKEYTVARDDSSGDIPNNLRKLPYLLLRVTTVTTPSLDVVNTTPAVPFVPRVGGTFVADPEPHFDGGNAFRFGFEALDQDGNIISFTAPVVWVPAARDLELGVDLPSVEHVDLAAGLYSGGDAGGLTEEERTSALDGQRFAYTKSNETDDAVLETQSITFDGFPFPDEFVDDDVLRLAYPLFFPVLSKAELALESVRQVSGQSADAVRAYQFHQAYVENAFTSANAGELMLTLHESAEPLPVSFQTQSDRSGGFVAPNFQINGISRKIGPIAGEKGVDAAAVAGDFDPREFFTGLGADLLPKLFGVLELTDILKATGLDQAPKYITQIVSGAMKVIADLELLANSLRAAGVQIETELASIETLFDDLKLAFDPDSPEQAEAAGRIADDINAVIGDLGTVPSLLDGLSINPPALKTDLLARAQQLADALDGAVAQLLQMINNLALAAEFPKEIRTHLEWRGKIRAWAQAPDDSDEVVAIFDRFFVPFDPNQPPNMEDLTEADSLLLSVDILVKTEGDPQINMKCSLEHFKVNLFGEVLPFLTLRFDLLEFSVQSGKKPDVRLLFSEPDGIEFRGPLKFIEKIKQFIPIDGFSDPPNLEVDASGIKAAFTLALPNVSVGVLSIENMTLSAGLRIPFIGDPLTFSFAFSSRENPFNLTVSLLGGGGFFGLELTPKGVRMLEAALEAGARISIDFGVASGSISAMIGIYFRIEKLSDDENQLLLTGYFKLQGQVDVLGLITASITLTLELTYQAEPVNKLYGRATLEIEIDIAFFSASVTITAERRFAGSSGDPTFFQIMAPEGDFRPWDDYLEAFAA